MSGLDRHPLDPQTLRALPKVALHDHLDGGLRARTLIDIAREVAHPLPTSDPSELEKWFYEAADSGSLERYLETFDHTIAVMQRAGDLRRVAREFVEDQAADGVVYAEARWAPEQHLRAGLTLSQAVVAVRDGLADGMVGCAAQGRQILVRQILSAMRQNDRSLEIAELAVAHRNDLVGGFDIAGPEAGFPPSRHLQAFAHLKRHNLPFTIHAGEAVGPESIWEAVQVAGTTRIGHGVRIVEDIQPHAIGGTPGSGARARLGTIAAYIRDRRITLEVCPTSNLQTGVAASYAEHPFGLLHRLGFTLTVSCDNRLMSGTTLTNELHQLVLAFGLTKADVHRLTSNALDVAFISQPVRETMRAEVIDPAYAS